MSAPIVASLTSVIQSKNHAKVHLVQQVADRIILRISGRLQPRLSVTDMRIAYNDPLNPVATRPATLTFNIVNSGNEVLGGKVAVIGKRPGRLDQHTRLASSAFLSCCPADLTVRR